MQSVLTESEPQHIGNILWALAKLEHFPGDKLMEDIITKVCTGVVRANLDLFGSNRVTVLNSNTSCALFSCRHMHIVPKSAC
jgi:hypothetical protein